MTPNWDMRTGSSANTHEAATGTADSHMGSEWQQEITQRQNKRLRHPDKTLKNTLRSLLHQDVCVWQPARQKTFLCLKSIWKMQLSPTPKKMLRSYWNAMAWEKMKDGHGKQDK